MDIGANVELFREILETSSVRSPLQGLHRLAASILGERGLGMQGVESIN